MTLSLGLPHMKPNHLCILLGGPAPSLAKASDCVSLSALTGGWALNKYVLRVKWKDVPFLTITAGVNSRTEPEASGEAPLVKVRVCSGLYAGQIHGIQVEEGGVVSARPRRDSEVKLCWELGRKCVTGCSLSTVFGL